MIGLLLVAVLITTSSSDCGRTDAQRVDTLSSNLGGRPIDCLHHCSSLYPLLTEHLLREWSDRLEPRGRQAIGRSIGFVKGGGRASTTHPSVGP